MKPTMGSSNNKYIRGLRIGNAEILSDISRLVAYESAAIKLYGGKTSSGTNDPRTSEKKRKHERHSVQELERVDGGTHLE